MQRKRVRILPTRKNAGGPPGKDKSDSSEVSANLREARLIWGPLPHLVVKNLRELTRRHHLSVVSGDIMLLGSQFYITHRGLLRIGERNHCSGIVTRLQKNLSDPTTGHWVFRATVFKSFRSMGFVGYGDADPTNTSPLVRGAEMRVAETRAVNRALRKAYGIGLCSVEELGSNALPVEPPNNNKDAVPPNGNNSSNREPRLRDKLCLLIRNYELDPTLVKRYAADFCGTESLREASRDLVESFVSTISQEAANSRAALVCKLNSYNQPEEVRP